MELIKYLVENAVSIDIKCKTKNEAIEYMVDKLCHVYCLSDNKDEILKTVCQREVDKSTGLGIELAIPHARTNIVDSIYIAMGISREGIEWDSIDTLPVKLIFLVVGASSKAEIYLKVLADISRLVKREDVKHKILAAKNPAQILRIIEENRPRAQQEQDRH
ncbi:PTS sugar transporter subunit IIA [Candidatus Auribacterota bacterium]